MKDIHALLHEKEQDVERVRREIRALRTVIQMLADDQPCLDITHQPLSPSRGTMANPPDDEMAQLETYFPFVKCLRKSKHL